jgi:hypothetical protein
MNLVPLNPPGAVVRQTLPKRKLRQNASFCCDNRGAAALRLKRDFPL